MNKRALEQHLSLLLAQWWHERGYGPAALAALDRNVHDTLVGHPNALREEDLRALSQLLQLAQIPEALVPTQETKK